VRRRFPSYHCRPVAPFGILRPRLFVVGLAPGLHGANRTARPFTGDHAGTLLYRTLHDAGFASGPQSAFAAKQAEGLGFAKAALAASREALGELGFRRRGLGVALGFCVLFLIALGLKIRQMGSR